MLLSEMNELFMKYAPIEELQKLMGMRKQDVLKCIQIFIPRRAKKSLDAVDLTDFKDELPIVKMLITKLSIIRNELFRRAHTDLSILTQAERVDNMLKKIKVNDASEWVEDNSDDIEIIEETGGYVTVNWVFIAETAHTKVMVEHAKVLTEKYLMKPDNVYVYSDIDAHIERCNRLSIDPKAHSESESQDLADTMDDHLKQIEEM